MFKAQLVFIWARPTATVGLFVGYRGSRLWRWGGGRVAPHVGFVVVLEPYVDSEHTEVWVKHAWWKLIHIKDKLK